MTLRHDTNYTPIRTSLDNPQEPETGDTDLHDTLSENHTCRSAFTRLKDGFERNTGLFLVIGSQAFLAFMNVAVKKLNSLDPPVPPLEVCPNPASPHQIKLISLGRCSAHRGQDGKLELDDLLQDWLISDFFTSGNYLCLLYGLHVSCPCMLRFACRITYVPLRLIRKVDDPWIGPKGVRLLLAFRGFTGLVYFFCNLGSMLMISN